MITFSSDQITFNYTPNANLVTTLAIRNATSNKHLYYKFKVSRQKYFMVKPDRSYIKPNESINIQITIHKDGIPQSNNDQFQLLYAFYDVQQKENYTDMFRAPAQFQSKKFPIVVNGAKHLMLRGSSASPLRDNRPLESLVNTQVFSEGKNVLQSKIEQKEHRVVNAYVKKRQLQEEVNRYQYLTPDGSSSSQKKKSSMMSWLVMAAAGLGLGIAAGFMIN